MTESTGAKSDQLADDREPSPIRLPHRRTDWYSARKIEEGVQLQAEAGTQAAAAFLRDHSIVADITVRTLLHPDQRRGS